MIEFLKWYFLVGLTVAFLGAISTKKPQTFSLWTIEIFALVIWPISFAIGMIIAVALSAFNKRTRRP